MRRSLRNKRLRPSFLSHDAPPASGAPRGTAAVDRKAVSAKPRNKEEEKTMHPRRRVPTVAVQHPSPPSPKKAKRMPLPFVKMSTVSNVMKGRLDPKQRGVHVDAVHVGVAPTSASACVDCGRVIAKGSARWGIKYGGNPLPMPVLPLYGSHPMVLWCHGPDDDANGKFCGLAFVRIGPHHEDPTSPSWLCDAARTCHLRSNGPDSSANSSGDSLRIVCGGGPNEHGKSREHAFHLRCWKGAMIQGANNQLKDESQRESFVTALKEPETKWKRHSSSRTSPSYDNILTYSQLTKKEQAAVRREMEGDS